MKSVAEAIADLNWWVQHRMSFKKLFPDRINNNYLVEHVSTVEAFRAMEYEIYKLRNELELSKLSEINKFGY